ncbi:hypothetical protein HMPREF9151_02552 [Hoylesella saccharolytica F0055]|uniref:Uncharacterized protein n=1 Tax=Hoylesella saccharolytica F0055 TaxID=1127699 RepID=L1MYG2_9BACT|nr:hypothetical protein HMPREF9151_02552 [Hoylesella saccharolytica F0055]
MSIEPQLLTNVSIFPFSQAFTPTSFHLSVLSPFTFGVRNEAL